MYLVISCVKEHTRALLDYLSGLSCISQDTNKFELLSIYISKPFVFVHYADEAKCFTPKSK